MTAATVIPFPPSRSKSSTSLADTRRWEIQKDALSDLLTLAEEQAMRLRISLFNGPTWQEIESSSYSIRLKPPILKILGPNWRTTLDLRHLHCVRAFEHLRPGRETSVVEALDHQRRRILLLHGPQLNQEAEGSAWRQALRSLAQ